MLVLPLGEMLARTAAGSGIPGSAPLVRHLTLWVALIGAGLAAREGKLLSLATANLFPEGRAKRAARLTANTVGAAVAAILAVASVELVVIERESGTTLVGPLQAWMAQLVLPVGFTLVALRLALAASERRWPRALPFAAVAGGALAAWNWAWLEGAPSWPWLLLVLIGTLAGGPIFAALGGAAALLFMADGIPPVAVLAETYRLTVSPTLPAIPLFTLVGFVLAEGHASARLLGVFRALFGWMSGGTAVVCALICAFFTIPTGGSGVTILALGGLLYGALRDDGYRERFGLGLLTASGSLGLLLPPALPLILYGIVAEIPIEDLFVGGLLPGLLLISLVAGWGMREGWRERIPRVRVSWREIARASRAASWELAIPLIAVVAIFGGFATLVEAAALVAAYVLVLQLVVRREIRDLSTLLRVFRECLLLLGGVLLILGVALGFTNWIVDAQIPSALLDWVQTHVESPWVFLLCLNLLLLLVGCFMDIFSATVVVVPLIVPLGRAFGIDPVHLGIIFVANLELGYLTPPVGLNLFLASYRFERPLFEIYRAAVPFLVILGIGVVLITYVPALTTWLPRLLSP